MTVVFCLILGLPKVQRFVGKIRSHHGNFLSTQQLQPGGLFEFIQYEARSGTIEYVDL